MGMRAVIPIEPAEINISTASETVQIWLERLRQQDKRHVREVLEIMEIHRSMAEAGCYCD
jgi:hypothetical protein